MSSHAETSSTRPRAKPGCPDRHKAVVERHMAAMLASHRQVPQDNEIFEDVDAFELGDSERVYCLNHCQNKCHTKISIQNGN